MNVLIYRLELLEPALITAIEGDPNSAVSLNYVAGSVLRGALIHRYLRENSLKAEDLLKDSTAQTVFFSGAARFLNGYLVKDGARTLPTPLSWRHPKGESQTVFDYAVAVPDEGKRRFTGFEKPFARLETKQIKAFAPERQITIHTQRDRKFGRPRKESDGESGAVYRYDALAAGQVFEAAIVCDDTVDLKALTPLLNGEVFIGGSRSGGYGRATLMFDPAQDVKTDAWREAGSTPLSAQVDRRLFITLLSDALLRDDNGQFTTDDRAVERRLREKLATPGLTFEAAFVRGRPVGGFNRKANLPLPQALAVQMGSVFVFHMTPPDAAPPQTLTERLRDLERTGIGERRLEGFGRVGVNWHTQASWPVFSPPKQTDQGPRDEPPPVPLTDSTSQTLATLMTRRLLRARLDEAVIAAANQLPLDHAPQPAQLTRLRSIIADELMKPEPRLKRLTDFMIQVEKRSAARKQFEAARIGADRERLLAWLKESEAKVADRARLLSAAQRVTVGNVSAEFKDTLRDEYVLRLIDTVLARAARAQRQEESGHA